VHDNGSSVTAVIRFFFSQFRWSENIKCDDNWCSFLLCSIVDSNLITLRNPLMGCCAFALLFIITSHYLRFWMDHSFFYACLSRVHVVCLNVLILLFFCSIEMLNDEWKQMFCKRKYFCGIFRFCFNEVFVLFFKHFTIQESMCLCNRRQSGRVQSGISRS
jgi:hypothetical protein